MKQQSPKTPESENMQEWKWDVSNYTHLWVYRNLSRHATWHQRSSNRIKATTSESTEQLGCKLFFRLDGTCNSQWSNYLTQRDEILSPRSNLTPQRAKNTVNDLRSVVSVLPKSLWHKSSWLNSFLSFFPETSKLQSVVYSEWKYLWLTLHSCWIHWEGKNDLMK